MVMVYSLVLIVSLEVIFVPMLRLSILLVGLLSVLIVLFLLFAISWLFL